MGWWDELESIIMDGNESRPVSKEALVEAFAELFHSSWTEITMGICSVRKQKADYNVCREWERRWGPYFELSEAQKELGRYWAKKVIKTLEDCGML